MNDLQEQQGCRVLPVEEALRYATGLAELIRHMHRDGTVCGRLDPKDFVWDNETVTLQRTDDASSGAYLAPEQIRGEAADVRSDIFAFGAILYEMLSGSRAFPARDPEDLKRQILEYTPPAIDGLPKGIASLIKSCLEKDRDLRLQRMNPVLIELKLAHASAQQAQASSDWRDKVVSLRSQVAAHEERLVGQQTSHAAAFTELRESIQRIEATLETINEAIAGLQKSAELNSKSIEGLQVAAAQTDEVVEHVVEAFGMMHKSLVERGDTKILLVARNGA